MAKVYILSGPSGSGKTSIVLAAMGVCRDINLVRSYTTRGLRPSEISGHHYEFVSIDLFERMVCRGEFVEWAQYPPGVGHFYGTPRAQILQDRKNLLEIDIQGARQIKKVFPEAVTIFVQTDLDELRVRLVKRGSLNAQEIERRLRRAYEELDEARGFYDRIIKNTGPSGLQNATLKLIGILSE